MVFLSDILEGWWWRMIWSQQTNLSIMLEGLSKKIPPEGSKVVKMDLNIKVATYIV